VDQVIALLRQRGRVTYRTLQLQFQLDDAQLAALKDELLYSQPHVVDDAGAAWSGLVTLAALSQPPQRERRYPNGCCSPIRHPISRRKSSPPAAPSKANASRSPCCFADLKGSMELLAERDPEEARSSSILSWNT